MSTLNDNARFKIYIKSYDDVNGYWYEVGNKDKNLVSSNYLTAAAADTDAGMKINTTTTFTANDSDEICIISHTYHITGSGQGVLDSAASNHRILKLKHGIGPWDWSGESNFKLKLCQSDVINKKPEFNGMTTDPWDFYTLETSNNDTVPIGENDTVTSMIAGGSSTTMTTELNILIGKNNNGWNISILDENFGMGDQGSVKFPQFASDHTEENGSTERGVAYGHSDLKHSQQLNLKKNSKSGFTMLGWYKSWAGDFPKLIDPFNIVSAVYYYDGSTNTYVEISKNSGTEGDWDGPSSSGGTDGKRAQTWNITTYGLSSGIWVEVAKEIADFETSGGMGSSNATSKPKAPFVFLSHV